LLKSSGPNSSSVTLATHNAIKILVIKFIHQCASFKFSYIVPQATYYHKQLGNREISWQLIFFSWNKALLPYLKHSE